MADIPGPRGYTGLRGPKGNTGEGGAGFWRGAYDPAVTYAKNDTVSRLGSCYICLSPAQDQAPESNIDTLWALVASKGDNGAAGANSTVAGPAGANGSVWRNGSGTPSNGTGADGDYYLNVTNGDVYRRSSGTYSNIGNIKGPAGSNGTNGSNGAVGSVWRNGSGTPSNSLGVDGDYYLDVDSGYVSKRIAGSYTTQGNIKGPAGDTSLLVPYSGATNDVDLDSHVLTAKGIVCNNSDDNAIPIEVNIPNSQIAPAMKVNKIGSGLDYLMILTEDGHLEVAGSFYADGGLSASNLTGALPSIDGNALTNLNGANVGGGINVNNVVGLATVATSGSYTDLSNQPNLPVCGVDIISGGSGSLTLAFVPTAVVVSYASASGSSYGGVLVPSISGTTIIVQEYNLDGTPAGGTHAYYWIAF